MEEHANVTLSVKYPDGMTVGLTVSPLEDLPDATAESRDTLEIRACAALGSETLEIFRVTTSAAELWSELPVLSDIALFQARKLSEVAKQERQSLMLSRLPD